MHTDYGRDLDLNLLRVFVVVAEAGSVTQAASRLYVTQPAVSAALRRLARAVGAPLFARRGRGLVLTRRGEQLLGGALPHLRGLVDAALTAPAFDPRHTDRLFRVGLSDATEGWLLAGLLRSLERRAPGVRLVVLPASFRTVGAALDTRQLDLAITVADDLPAGVRREVLFGDTFVALFDGRTKVLPKRPSRRDYFGARHVVVSYNGDLRGLVEDQLGLRRDVRCSVSSFRSLGAVLEGSSLVATVPARVALELRHERPRLRAVPLPFELGGSPVELLSRPGLDDDDAVEFLRQVIREVAGRGVGRRSRIR